MPYLIRMITDVIAITAMGTIGIYHISLYRIRQKFDSEPSDLFFALMLFSMALYIFFDNTLSLLVFDPVVAAMINTSGVSFSSFSGLVWFLLFTHRILGTSNSWRFLLRITGFISFLVFLASFSVWKLGYLEYMGKVDLFLIVVYLILMLIHTVIFIRAFVKKKIYLDPGIMLLFAASYLFIISTFFFRFLISIDIRFYEYNNYIAPMVAVFCFPILLLSKSKKDFIDLMQLKEELKQSPSADVMQRRLPVFIEQFGLNDRQTDVLEKLVLGLEYKEIAALSGLSLSGVKKRAHSLYRKSGVSNRTELIRCLLND